MGEISLDIENLNFSYGSNKILQDLNFKINKGSFVSIIGPNGSGKTTLLKNISASLKPDEGKVFLKEKNIFDLKPKKLAQDMAVVPQDTSVTFQFTVLDTVLLGRLPHLNKFQRENSKDIAIAQWAMELTNTWDLKDRAITEISGGERQRVIVARALAQQPDIILLDEPVAHLDLQHQMELLELLKSLQESKSLTILSVLHDLNLAAQFSDYILLMDRGEIYCAGSPAEVLTASNIEKVYNMEVVIMPNELTGSFNIIPITKSNTGLKNTKNCTVHLVCGGGTGSFVMENLVQSGYHVSCGVLNIGDSDWNKAKNLGLEIAEEAPFSPISDNAYYKNHRLLEKADAVVLMPLPVGRGNLCNLEQVYRAQEEGKKVIVVGKNNLKENDFTAGEGEKYIESLLKTAVVIDEARSLSQILNTVFS